MKRRSFISLLLSSSAVLPFVNRLFTNANRPINHAPAIDFTSIEFNGFYALYTPEGYDAESGIWHEISNNGAPPLLPGANAISCCPGLLKTARIWTTWTMTRKSFKNRLLALEPMEILTLIMIVLGIVLVILSPPHAAGPPLH